MAKITSANSASVVKSDGTDVKAVGTTILISTSAKTHRRTRTDVSLKYKALGTNSKHKTVDTRQFYPRLAKLPTHQCQLPFFLKAPTTQPQEQESSWKVPGIQPCTHQTFEDRYKEPHQP